MKKAVTIGYASIDYPVVLDGYFQAHKTTLIRNRSHDAFPRPGGCPLYTAIPLASYGFETSVITWVGDDDLGKLYQAYSQERKIKLAGIACLKGCKTPMCFLIYQEDGSCACLFDPVFSGQEQLTADQVQVLKEADLVTFTVGPPNVALEVFNYIPDTAKVAWVGKNDSQAYPEALRVKLAQCADYIFCDRNERATIDKALIHRKRPAPFIVETNGADKVKIDFQGRSIFLDTIPVNFDESTGAGDTLAGGCLASILLGNHDMKHIGQFGIQAATELLQRGYRDK